MEDYLTYPFDVGLVLRKKKSIKRGLLEQPNLIEKKIAILGGSTTSEIRDILELFLLKDRIKPVFYESGFNKYYEDIMFENPDLLKFKPEIVYIHTTSINLNYPQQLMGDRDYIEGEIEKEIIKFKNIWVKIQQRFNCSIIQNNFELPFYRILGNLDFSNIYGKVYFTTRLNMEFARYAQENKNFYINDINYLSSQIGLEKWYDRFYWYSYKYAFSYEVIPLLSYNLANIIKSIYGRGKKCLVLDLDNVLWGGIIGDDGFENIKIGKETPVAEAYTEFQQYVKNLKKRGVILAICSKNDPAVAKEGFSHPDSILKLEDFTVFKVNWNPKDENIIEIAKELNIGLDSIVFIDDNPAEREIVKANLKEVSVPDIGDSVVNYINVIEKGGYFEPVTISGDDVKRYIYYKDNIKRLEGEKNFSNYDDFLKSLGMTAQIQEFVPLYLDRIAQLINKTNQFNLTTKRYNYSEVEAIDKDDNYITLCGRLIDKFGDNGLISMIIGDVKKDHKLHINLWLMSCRVFKRGMEYAMFDALIKKCKEKGISEIIGYYYKTEKNNIVSQHYQEMGFEFISKNENGDTIWRYNIPKNYADKNKIIQIEDIKHG